MVVFIIIIILAVLFCSILLKVLKLSTLLAGGYEVHGVDVSHYQGDIDWTVLQSQNIDFAYIKATEGSSSVDEKFVENWEEAEQTFLKVGAYHFFSFDSEGKTQAQNYIQTVGALEGKHLSIAVFLPIQLLLCFKAKRRMIRLLPVIILSVLTVFFLVMAVTATGWDGIGYIFLAIFISFMLLACGIGWGIWAIIRFVKKKAW